MSIRTKILALVLGAVLLVGVVGTLVGRTIASDALEEQARAQLIDMAMSRSAVCKPFAIDDLLNRVRGMLDVPPHSAS